MIERTDIEKLAHLARIKVSDAEIDALRAEIGSILGYVSELQSVDVPAENIPAKEDLPVYNVLRKDGEPHESGIHTEALIQEAPASEDGYIKVKKIL